MYAALVNAIIHDESLAELSALALRCGAPSQIISKAQQNAGAAKGQNDQYNRFLFHLLRGDANLHRLRSILSAPQLLSTVAAEMAGVDGDPQTIIDLVNLAVRARPDADSISLLPARYHVFVRSLEGAFICLNHTLPIHAHEGKPRLFLNRHESCPHCQSKVFEMATCPRCGTAYLVGREVTPEGKSYKVVRHPSSMSDDLTADLSYFVLPEEHIHEPDEDEAVLNGQPPDQIENEVTDMVTLCLGCGAIGNENSSARCSCPSHAQRIQLRRVVVQDPPLRRCVSCGVRSTTGVVYRFLTGRDAPVSVLATSLYQLLPPSDDEKMAGLSGEGRKLMVFADSRQDAAFFAPYLERTYRQVLRRRLILKALMQDSAGRSGHLRLQDTAERVRRESDENNLFTIEQSQDKRTRLALLWLMQEFVALDMRIGLEGLGLLHFRLVPPQNWESPTPLLAWPWNLTPEEAWTLTIALLDSVRRQGAVSFPENVDPKSVDFEPRNVRIFVSDYADHKQNVLGWLPKRGSNRRMEYLVRILNIRQPSINIAQATVAARDLLTGLWKHLTAAQSSWRTHFQAEKLKMGGIAYQLNHKLWEWVPTHEASIPVYYCDSCFNITYTNINHVCPQYGCDGKLRPTNDQSEVWRSNHYRNLYQQLNPIGLSVEEHTAQWTPEIASDIQSKFISGQINVLSCSTTFELGVDVGELQTVLMRNMPPTTANYVQRAGRAGRRTDSVAFVLTFAQRRSHDLTYFKHPERMVAGRVNPPVVVVQNEKIVRRHVHSVFIAAFLRWALDKHQRKFEKVGDFFAATSGKTPGTELFRQYVAMCPSTVGDALFRIVPHLLHDEIGIQDWSWLSALTSEDGKGILDRATQEIHNDLNIYAQLEAEAVRDRRYKQAEHFQRVATTVQSRELLGFLGTRNVLPKYGFPVDVVELRTDHIPVPEASHVELDRDLRIAISEYAPGSEVVAAKRIWVGEGLYRMPGRDWQTMQYAVCPGCGRFHRSLQSIESVCNVCGTNVFGWPKRYGKYVIPEFGFIASRDTREPGERRPQRTYASQVYFSDYESGDNREIPPLELISDLSSEAIELRSRYSRFGKLAVVNSGFSNAGFRICESCGWAEPEKPIAPGRRPARQSEHKNPRTGNPCNSRPISRHLGHEFGTDVLELRFSGYLAPRDNQELWISVLYAILEGASETLGIARDDLNGTLYPYNTMNPPALILFDNVPGGAGHVKRLNNSQALKAILRSSLERVTGCECGEETSCYECLRNFYNQYYHDQLRRGLVRDFLRQLLEQTEKRIA